MNDVVAEAHDLVLLRDRNLLRGPTGRPLDAAALAAAEASVNGGGCGAWAVVRRAPARPGWVAVGLRGGARKDRFAAFALLREVDRTVSPSRIPLVPVPDRAHLPAFAVLRGFVEFVALVLPGAVWGPGGSVGYELVTGREVVTATSDLDIVLTAPRALDRERLVGLFSEMPTGPAHVDVQVQTPFGAFALEEWLRVPAGAAVALRTSGGPRLTTDPWGRG